MQRRYLQLRLRCTETEESLLASQDISDEFRTLSFLTLFPVSPTLLNTSFPKPSLRKLLSSSSKVWLIILLPSTFSQMAHSNILICLFRRDLRISDNPIFNALVTQKDHGFTHLLPLYIFPAQQIELSGFIKDESTKSPYPEARSRLGGFWRCGPHRAEFLAESVWDLKSSLEKIGSGLCIRVGTVAEVMNNILEFGGEKKIGAVWMTREEGVEEDRDEHDAMLACHKVGADFKLWVDEKYLIDEYVSSFPLRLLEIDTIAVAIYHSRTQKTSQMFILPISSYLNRCATNLVRSFQHRTQTGSLLSRQITSSHRNTPPSPSPPP